MSEPAATRPQPARPAAVLLCAALLAGVAHACWLSATRPFAMDELTYGHIAWQLSQGKQPYLDLFAHHTPGLWQLLAPVHGLVDSSRGFLTLSRWLLCGVWLAQLALLWRLAAPRVGRVWALLAPLTALTTQVWLDHAIELRPDPLAWALYLGVLALLDVRAKAPADQRGRRHRLRVTLAGAGVVLACWVSPKVGLYGAGLLAMWVIDGLRGRRAGGARGTPALVRPLDFVTGAAVAVAGLAGWLAARGMLTAFWTHVVVWPMTYESSFQGFPWWLWLGPSLRGSELTVALATLGAVTLVRHVRAGGTGTTALAPGRRGAGAPGVDMLLLWTAPLALLSVAIQSAAYPYSFQPLFGCLALGVPLGAKALRQLLVRRAPRLAGLTWLIVTAALALSARQATDTASRPPLSKRSGQLAVLDNLERLTDAIDATYDNTGQGLRRPSVHYFGFTNHFVRATQAALLSRAMPKAMYDAGCVVHLIDTSTDKLPRPLRDFLATHFLPWSADIHLWGQAFPVKHGGRSQGTFLAPRTATWLVEPMVPGRALRVWVDGQEVRPAKPRAGPPAPTAGTGLQVRLRKGPHRVEVQGGGAWILWRPRDGRRWRPTTGQAPRLRHVL